MWTFTCREQVEHQWIIVLGVTMDYEQLNTAPEVPAAREVLVQYSRAARAAKHVTNWIHRRGFPATAYTGPQADTVQMIPAAIACGLGELGKHGSMINREFGSSFRLSAVTTDMPLVADGPDVFGADDFCTRCKVCENACPPAAIHSEKQWVRGEYKWYVDFDKCIPYFDETHGCAICLAACPWSAPGRAPLLAEKWQKRKAKKGPD
jgi:epoxyqueuosine reductase QueG